MDDFTSALRKGLKGTVSSPVFIVAGLLSGIVSAISIIQYGPFTGFLAPENQDLAGMVLVLLTSIVVPLLTMAFITGGALGCAAAQARGENVSFGLFVREGKKHYLNLLWGGIGALIVFYFLAIVLLLLVGLGSVSAILLLLLSLGSLALMFAGLMAIEFYDIAIVADGLDFTRAFPASIGFVRKHLPRVIPFFLIVLLVKLLVELPLFTAILLKEMAAIAANLTYYDNGTINATGLNETLNSSATALQVGFSIPSLAAIMVLQGLVQAVVFAFLVCYKAEFYRWVKGLRKITDFDYDFSGEKQS